MADPGAPPPPENSPVLYPSNHDHHPHHHHHHRGHYLGPNEAEDAGLLPNGKTRLRKTHSSPISGLELPPLVGALPQQGVAEAVTADRLLNQSHQQREPNGPQTRLGSEGEAPGTAGSVAAPSPLMRRRLKYMVRQCSDSELLKKNAGLARLKLAGVVAASPGPGPCPGPCPGPGPSPGTGTGTAAAPHPPDTQSPRSQGSSSEANSPRVQPRRHHRFGGGSARADCPGRRPSRSLDASPLVGRRYRDSSPPSSSSVPHSPSPCPEGRHRPRPFSFGSFTDVFQHQQQQQQPHSVGGEALGAHHQALTASPVAPGSPFVTRRLIGLRAGAPLPSPSRPDTPATDAVSHNGRALPTSSGERSGLEEDEGGHSAEECFRSDEQQMPRTRARSRRDSGNKQQQLRNASAPSCGGTHLPPGSCGSDSAVYSAEQAADVEDLPGFPSDLYDIQERRESILSIEAVQEIARRFASTVGPSDGEPGTGEADANEPDGDRGEEKQEKTGCQTDEVPDYRKEPLSNDTRVSNWLKGIQDPTEGVPARMERILPDIM